MLLKWGMVQAYNTLEFQFWCIFLESTSALNLFGWFMTGKLAFVYKTVKTTHLMFSTVLAHFRQMKNDCFWTMAPDSSALPHAATASMKLFMQNKKTPTQNISQKHGENDLCCLTEWRYVNMTSCIMAGVSTADKLCACPRFPIAFRNFSQSFFGQHGRPWVPVWVVVCDTSP